MLTKKELEITKLGSRTYMVKGSTNIGLYNTHDNKVAIIETDFGECSRQLDQILIDNGWEPECIINSHTHLDHIGGNQYFMEKYNIPAYCTAEEIVFSDYPDIEASFMQGGYPARALRSLFKHPGKIGFRPVEEMDIPGIEIIDLPGHTPAMIGIMTEDGIFFTGDAYLSLGYLKKNKFGYIYRIDKFLDTLHKIKKIKAKMYIPGHGRAENNIDETVAANISNIDYIVEIINKCCSEPKGLDDILQTMYESLNVPKGPGYHAMLSATTRSMLSYLQDNGVVKCIFKDNKMMWETRK